MGWIVSSENSCPPKPQNVTFENRIFENMLVELRCVHTALEWALNLRTGVLKRGENTQWYMQRKQAMWRWDRVGVMLSQTKNHLVFLKHENQKLQEAKTDRLLSLQKELGLIDILILNFLTSRTVREKKTILLF